MVVIFHVRLSLKINADGRDLSLIILTMDDMTNLNLEITKDLTLVLGLHRVLH